MTPRSAPGDGRLTRHRQRGPNLRALTGDTAHLDSPPCERCALVHLDEPKSSRPPKTSLGADNIEALAVVGDEHPEPIRMERDDDVHPGGLAMAQRVVQRRFHD